MKVAFLCISPCSHVFSQQEIACKSLRDCRQPATPCTVGSCQLPMRENRPAILGELAANQQCLIQPVFCKLRLKVS